MGKIVTTAADENGKAEDQNKPDKGCFHHIAPFVGGSII
jgi:hypothetical protein